jgi:adenylate cyclase, class 2
MAVEIESKIKVENHEQVRAKLSELGAKPAGNYLEINTFFDTHDRSLVAADKGLRIRINQNVTDNTKESIVTFKGPRQKAKFKSREETEFTISSPENASAMLKMLGFEQVLRFEKKRESWIVDRCRVELDEMPQLGKYVEVEGPSDASVTAVREKLGLGGAPTVHASYAAMLTTYLQEIGSSDRNIGFHQSPKTPGKK